MFKAKCIDTCEYQKSNTEILVGKLKRETVMHTIFITFNNTHLKHSLGHSGQGRVKKSVKIN
jgi:hypothetical protein